MIPTGFRKRDIPTPVIALVQGESSRSPSRGALGAVARELVYAHGSRATWDG